VVTFLLAIALFAAIAYHVVTPEERTRLLRRVDPVAAVIRAWITETAPLRVWLRARTPWLVVTPLLALVNVAVYVCAAFTSSASTDEGLLRWGAIQAQALVAGEWWRLATASVVNDGAFALFVILLGLMQLGALLERLVGPLTVACVYFAAGAMAHIVGMTLDVTAMQSGGVAAIAGLYGLLLSASGWRRLRRVEPAIPAPMFTLLAPGAALLLVASVASDGLLSERNLVALTVGLLIGFAGSMKSRESRRPVAQVGFATAAVVAILVVMAVPIYGSINLRSQLTDIVALEERTAESYRQALRRFTNKRVPVEPRALLKVIDDGILPDLTRASAGMTEPAGVPPEYAPLMAHAADYLRLRRESWTMRAIALRKGSIALLQQADSRERQALEALAPLRHTVGKRSE
jgi:rhomboid protease GluP